jgi:DNA mismatch repair protein MutS
VSFLSFALLRKYTTQYGERTTVLFQMGTFYETWGYDPNCCLTEAARIDKDGQAWNDVLGHSEELSMVLKSQLTQENKNEPYSINNPHKVGIPMISYEKAKRNLLLNDFTIVRMDQGSGTNEKGRQNRFVAEIVSPTIQIDVQTPRATSNLVCIYIEYQSSSSEYEDFLITTGIAAVDIITGENRACEFFSKEKDQVYAIQELFRFIKSHAPREVLLYVDDMPPGLDTHSDEMPNPYVRYLVSTLELQRYDRLSVYVNEAKDEYKKSAFQCEFLNRIFTRKPGTAPTGLLQLNVVKATNPRIVEEMHLERMNYGRIAYIILLQYCYSHNPDIVSRLTRPDTQWIDEDRHLILAHNAIDQLDINPKVTGGHKTGRTNANRTLDSLFTLLDHNQTALGRRALQSLLQNPMTAVTEIQKSYDMVGEMLTTKIRSEDLWLALDKRLKGMVDIGHLHRKLELHVISPKELTLLYKAYTGVVDCYRDVVSVPVPTLQRNMLAPQEVAQFNEFLSRFGALLNFAALECCSIETVEGGVKWMKFKDCPIIAGYYPEVDAQVQSLVSATTTLQQIVDHLNLFLSKSKGEKLTIGKERKKPGKIHSDDRTMLVTSNAKAKTLLAASIDTTLCGVLQASPVTTSEQMITSERIMTLCAHIDGAQVWLKKQLYSIFLAVVDEMSSKYSFYRAVAELVGRLDLMHCYASVAFRYNYHRPVLQNDGTDSYLAARDLRHPLIEQLIDGAYVPNNLFLGGATETNGQATGMLLYGVNQTGKTSLAKAVGLAIIMAQAGCYTACHLTYKPYRRLITRLSGGDNMFKGDSSYAVEMRELRTIDRQANAHTLVIGDELCHGTETDSGQAITAAAVLTLVQRRTSFIFATHMHELVERSRICALRPHELRISHLSVTRDDAAKVLIYDRKLAEGHGSSLYGAIVAQHLGMSPEFMNLTYEILNEVTGRNPEVIAAHHSRYNSAVYVDMCAMCGKTGQETTLHTHHIQPQELADERGLIGNMPKNKKGNLLVLCHSCHTNLHAEGKELVSVTTAAGQLVVAPE